MLSPMLADAALAQPRRKVWRIGYFFLGSRESAMQTQRYTPFLEGMLGLGYVEGRDFTLDARFADGDSRRFKSMAEDLIQGAPDIIVVTGSPLYTHLKKANKSTPIVVTVSPDPVAEGIAKSLPRPGGHFTGLTFEQPAKFELTANMRTAKLLKLEIPRQVLVLADPRHRVTPA